MNLCEGIHKTKECMKMYEEKACLCRQRGNVDYGQIKLYEQYADEQRQILEWLKELQKLRWMNHMDAE